MKAFKVTTIDHKPTIAHPCGVYKVIRDGLYWGHYYVGHNWYGAKFVADADPRDGLPW